MIPAASPPSSGLLQLAFRMWERESSSLLGMTVRGFRALGIGLALLAVAFIAASLSTLTTMAEGIDTTDPAELLAVVRAIGNGALLSAIVIGTIFGLLDTDSSRLEVLLQLVGAGRVQRLAVLLAPVAVIAGITTALVVTPLALLVAGLSPSLAFRSGMVAVLLVMGFIGSLAGLATQQAIAAWLRHRLRLNPVHANAAAAAAVLVLALALCYPAFDPGVAATGWRSLSPAEVPALVGRATIGGEPTGWLAVGLMGLALAATAIAISAGTRETRDAAIVSRRVRSHVPPPRSPIGTLVWFEVVTLARSSATLMSLLGVLVCAIAAVALRDRSVGELALLAAPAVAGATALRATGVTLSSAWVIWTIRGKGLEWALAKLAGAACVGLALFGLSIPFLWIAAGGETVGGLALQVFLPVLLGSLAAGAVFPVSDEQPLSTAIGGALAMAITGGLFAGVGAFLDLIGIETPVVALAIFGVMTTTATIIALGRIRPEAVIRHV